MSLRHIFRLSLVDLGGNEFDVTGRWKGRGGLTSLKDRIESIRTGGGTSLSIIIPSGQPSVDNIDIPRRIRDFDHPIRL